MKHFDTSLLCVAIAGILAWTMVLPVQAVQSASQIKREVERALRDNDDLRRIDVSVSGSEVTLSGSVPHLLAKNRAVQDTLKGDGVETVVSELELPEEEEDSELAERVAQSVNRYAHYTIWDYIDGRIEDGIVTLYGSVTPDRDKKGDLYERVAKIRGVTDYVDEIEIQSVSSGDVRLRSIIGRQLAGNIHLQRTAVMRTPPYHIVVSNSIVTLIGYVQSQIEYIEMERIVRHIQGVLRVDNQLQVVG